MREIKFRGKRLDNGEWVEGFYWALLDPHSEETKWRDHYIHNSVSIVVPVQVDPSTIGQFTGLTDKNGKEIWEGDIVNSMAAHPLDVYKRTVVYKDCGLQLNPLTGYNLCIDNQRHFEVIGNIHDNPELIQP